MARYFAIHNGLRGCYMPDNGSIIRCDTRRELKNYIEGELRDLADAGFVGAAKRHAATLAARLWRREGGEHVIPLAPSHAPRNYCYGLSGSVSSRAEWKESA